jgi:hypothetical protein
MRREHYWMLANALNAVPNEPIKTELVLELCKLMKAADHKFNEDLFLDTSGI